MSKIVGEPGAVSAAAHPVMVIGGGPGDESYLTMRAREAIDDADRVYAANRYEHMVPSGKRRGLEPLGDGLISIERDHALGLRVAVIVSGDPGVYSMLGMLTRRLGRGNLQVIPGISAMQSLCASLGEMWQNAAVLSGHGRNLSESAIAYTVRHNESTIIFCDERRGPAWVCRAVQHMNDMGLQAAIGERLTSPDERITRGSPDELARGTYNPLSIVRINNPNPEQPRLNIGIPDEQFTRGKTPMTKREIRALAAASLRPHPSALVWDIGAGTGSVSIECALQCPFGEVYAIDSASAACELIGRNARAFGAANINIIEGSAPAALTGLPHPTHVFIGGTSGETASIIHHIESLRVPIRLVVTAVTLETAYETIHILSNWKNIEAAQHSSSRLEPVGSYHMFKAQNPVFIISADWEVLL